jgi:acetyl-CoA acetyltransferase
MTFSSRNPAKDKVAVASAASTGYAATNTRRTQLSYAVEASQQAIRAAGLGAADVDGIIGSSNPSAWVLQQALGIPEVTFFANPPIPFINQLSMAVGAIYGGLCEVVLAVHAPYRLPWNTGSAVKDPFRRRGQSGPPVAPESVAGSVGYTSWASRYLAQFKIPRETLGLVPINERSNAARNPGAALREPLSMEAYLSGRMVRDPLCVYDMDISVDGADAFILTSTERARDLKLPPVLVNAVTVGTIAQNDEAQTPSLRQHGQQLVVSALKGRADFWTDDIDLFFPYDGFSIITLNWIENVGYAEPGGAGDFLRKHWVESESRVMIDGRIPLNPHGGNLAEGASQGSGHVREAVHQLQGLAGERQVEGAQRALLTLGGFFFNAQGAALRRE